MKIIGYARLSRAREGSEEGYGLEGQRTAIENASTAKGAFLVGIESDNGASGKTGTVKPGLERALLMLATHRADCLMVAKLDRVSRSSLDFAKLLERSRLEGWKLVALDMGLDTSTAVGEMTASVLMSFAQFERRCISERTSAGLQVARARLAKEGRKLGRPRKHAA